MLKGTTIKAKVHLLATDNDNPTQVSIMRLPQKNKLYSHVAGGEFRRGLQMGHQPQHLYFTTDEEIKEGDWRLYYNTGKICKTTKEDLLLIKYYEEECKKIVATTNPELWVNKQCETYKKEHCGGYCCSVPKIDIPFIEAYIKAYNEGKPITEVLLELKSTAICNKRYYISKYEHDWLTVGKEYEIIGKGLFDNVCIKNDCGAEVTAHKDWFTFNQKLKLKSNGSVTVHPVKERMYTREEFKKAMKYTWIFCNGPVADIINFEAWFNQNYPE